MEEATLIQKAIDSLRNPRRSVLRREYEARKPDNKHVYLAYCPALALWKIGQSKSPKARMSGAGIDQGCHFGLSSSVKLRLIISKEFNYGRLVEMGLHEEFKPHAVAPPARYAEAQRIEIFRFNLEQVASVISFLGGEPEAILFPEP